jgi:CheY-like chemotaxis protein
MGQKPIDDQKVGLHGKLCDEPARMPRPRVLLVGGHPLVAEMLTEHFHVGKGYELEAVQDCDDALAVLQGRRVDLVLVLSLHVPWRRWHSPARRIDLTNAILFLKHMRALHNPPPVIVVSGVPLAEAEKEALAHGAFAYIQKPFDLGELDRFVVLALDNR